jgi:hypothetical protein
MLPRMADPGAGRATKSALDRIPGWFWPQDVALFRWFLSEQSQSGVHGDLAELGAYLGKSAVLLGDYLRPTETLTVIDLFEGEAVDEANAQETGAQYAGLSQTAFETNYRSVHGTLPVVIRGFSQDIGTHVPAGSCRFVHVDASHLYEHVRGDIAAVRELVGPGAVVVFDDIRSAHTPGVVGPHGADREDGALAGGDRADLGAPGGRRPAAAARLHDEPGRSGPGPRPVLDGLRAHDRTRSPHEPGPSCAASTRPLGSFRDKAAQSPLRM